MSREPVQRGEISDGEAFELLRDIEAKRITGRLCFESLDGGTTAEIALVGGEIAVDQAAGPDGADPVDRLLTIGAVRYEVFQTLPPLAVSRGDEQHRFGSLAVHVPADLMNYCERAGLSGVLELRHEQQTAEAFYDAGELIAIKLDGDETGDLSEVFAWVQGRFRVVLDPDAADRLRREEHEVAPAPPLEDDSAASDGGWTGTASRNERGESTRQFLKVVEIALSDVVAKSEGARSPTRTSPPLPPPPKARPRPDSLAPLPERPAREQTVRLIYLSGEPAGNVDNDTSTRHVRTDVRAELALTEARPERRAPREELLSMAKKKKKRQQTKAATSGDEDLPAAPPVKRPKEAPREAAPKDTPAAETPPGATSPAAPPVLRQLATALAWSVGVLGLGMVILFGLARLQEATCGELFRLVDRQQDATHCGECDHACRDDAPCRAGACVTAAAD